MQKDKLQSSTEEQQPDKESSGKLMEQVTITGTPFTAIKLDDKWFLAMGKYRVSEVQETFEDVLILTKEINWNLLATLCTIMYQELSKSKETETNTKTN